MMDEFSISQKVSDTIKSKIGIKSSIIYTDGRDPEERMNALIEDNILPFNFLNIEIKKINKKNLIKTFEKLW